jgi:hypothetical protein
MKKIQIIVLSTLLCLFVITSVYTEPLKPVGQATMTFLKIDPVARTVGMGEATTCIDKDVNALFHNPAGTASISGGALSLNQTQWLADTKQYGIAAAYGHGILGTFGLSFIYMDNGDIPRTIPDGSEKGFYIDESFTVNQFAAGVSYARKITNKFSVGGQIRYVYQDLGPADIVQLTTEGRDTLWNHENKKGKLVLDFGTLYYTGFKDLRVAMCIRNFGSSVKYTYDYYQLPLVLRIGIAMDVFSVIPGLDGHSLQMIIETVLSNDYSERVNFGWEYGFKNLFFIRTGYKYNYDVGSFSAGFGCSPTITGLNLKLDYAYSEYGDVFGAVHRVSFGFGL